MKLIQTSDNQPILSNVGEVGEFRIRNSAKAFNILSSGLYANKIRAIIRELSCNAVDSHVAAGKADVPFEVHLPTALSPWFSVRDFGTGLSHDQVTQIYTTYFESTKTQSNDFIGALGLGSKSPFSYTNNFTVTAIQNGRKGIYSAFINDAGVPSIALMMEEQTDEPNGVEVKFAVENIQEDAHKFRHEVKYVYLPFKLKPIVKNFGSEPLPEFNFIEKDIIPGVSEIKFQAAKVYALMGNILYPVEFPQASANFETISPRSGANISLKDYFNHSSQASLLLEFGIGELDFQASREGLSYIPQTINAIKHKLALLHDHIEERIAKDAEQIENLWERACYIRTIYMERPSYWRNSMLTYIASSASPQFIKLMSTMSQSQYWNWRPIIHLHGEDFNIAVKGFMDGGYDRRVMSYNHDARIAVSKSTVFLVTDIERGANSRISKYAKSMPSGSSLYVLSKKDPAKEMNLEGFFENILNPPKTMILNVSSLEKPPRSLKRNKIVNLLRPAIHRNGRIIWSDAGKIDSFDKTKTYYYIPMKNYSADNLLCGGTDDLKEVIREVMGCRILSANQIFGVRKTDIGHVKALKNWLPFEQSLIDELRKITEGSVMRMILLEDFCSITTRFDSVAFVSLLKYNVECKFTSKYRESKYQEFLQFFEKINSDDPKITKFSGDHHYISGLLNRYAKLGIDGIVSERKCAETLRNMVFEVFKAYPMLKYYNLGYEYATQEQRVSATEQVYEYINLVDSQKSVNTKEVN